MPSVVLIGENIAHSLSPRIHNHLFERYGLPHRYELMPLEAKQAPKEVERMKLGGFLGANITSPHKLVVLPALDALSEEARAVGAINTIRFHEGIATGYNTDVAGVAKALAGDPVLDAPFTAAVLGAGGAARAAIRHLLTCANLDRLTIYSRDREKAAALIDEMNLTNARPAALGDFSAADLVVHATPVGLPGVTGYLPDEERLAGGTVLFEMIYRPRRTGLVLAAERVGMRSIPGIGMLVGQAIESFRIWTGVEATESDIPDELLIPSEAS